jgi:hypothetical protein
MIFRKSLFIGTDKKAKKELNLRASLSDLITEGMNDLDSSSSRGNSPAAHYKKMHSQTINYTLENEEESQDESGYMDKSRTHSEMLQDTLKHELFFIKNISDNSRPTIKDIEKRMKG